MLGYFLDANDAELARFSRRSARSRRQRVAEILARLAALGVARRRVDAPGRARRSRATRGRAPARGRRRSSPPATRRDIADAFDRYLGTGRPAFVPRIGAPPCATSSRASRARGGVVVARASGQDRERRPRPRLRGATGWTRSRCYHPDHDEAAVARYRALAASAGRLVTGGSDYHGPGSGRSAALGRVGLPRADYARLADRLAERGARAMSFPLIEITSVRQERTAARSRFAWTCCAWIAASASRWPASTPARPRRSSI